MLRQGDAQVFKRYSQTKLAMMWEALVRLGGEVTSMRGFLKKHGQIRPFLKHYWNISDNLEAMKNLDGLKLKDLAGGDDGTRTRDLMRNRHPDYLPQPFPIQQAF